MTIWTEGRTSNEVRNMYGLHDPEIPVERANEIIQSVFQLFSKGINENILKEEFVRLLESGGDLPDCEFDGHHGDDEWEVTIPMLIKASSFIFGWSADDSLKYIMLSNFILTMNEMNQNGTIRKI
jgi:hypothetical protein